MAHVGEHGVAPAIQSKTVPIQKRRGTVSIPRVTFFEGDSDRLDPRPHDITTVTDQAEAVALHSQGIHFNITISVVDEERLPLGARAGESQRLKKFRQPRISRTGRRDQS